MEKNRRLGRVKAMSEHTIMRSRLEIQAIKRFRTPAKLTPYLRVLRLREDGFHQVELALVPVTLFDTIEFRPGTRGGLSLETRGLALDCPPEQNLVYRAAVAFGRAAGLDPDLQITLEKTIPPGAGLGGGSGNAAGTLVALNAAAGHLLDERELRRLALELGSDVPFFLAPRPVRARGRGEELEPLERFPAINFLVVMPPLSISTAEAYRIVEPEPAAEPPPKLGSFREVVQGLRNSFEPALFLRYPELARVKAALLENGAVGALLSGSGAALFGLFSDPAARDAAERRLREIQSWRVLPCDVLQHYSYLEPA